MAAIPRIRIALLALSSVLVAGTAGYTMLGFGLLDALYQTVTTVTTVGFREVHPLTATGQLFTIALILVGVGTALYALGALLEVFVEGDLRNHVRRRRMDRTIDRMSGHVIVCGWGRVGASTVPYLITSKQKIVVVDRDPARLERLGHPHVIGDVTDDRVLQEAGIERAQALIAAVDSDADNVYVTLSARATRPDLVIIARARDESSTSKLLRAGADRVVNPQLMGGRRMAAFALQPDVADFLDVVMHDASLDYRLEQFDVGPRSPLAGRSLRDVDVDYPTTALVVAVRRPEGSFVASPDIDTPLEAGSVLIAFGNAGQLAAMRQRVAVC